MQSQRGWNSHIVLHSNFYQDKFETERKYAGSTLYQITVQVSICKIHLLHCQGTIYLVLVKMSPADHIMKYPQCYCQAEPQYQELS